MVCFYPKFGIKKARLKRAGRSRDPKKPQKEPGNPLEDVVLVMCVAQKGIVHLILKNVQIEKRSQQEGFYLRIREIFKESEARNRLKSIYSTSVERWRRRGVR